MLKVWPLTTLRRWAATPTTFTLDFGDYADSYYSVQTTEGDAISQLIGGYIDIILKRKKDSDRMLADGDTDMAITEENVVPGRAAAASYVQGRGGQATTANVAQAGMVSRGQVNAANISGSSARVAGLAAGQVRPRRGCWCMRSCRAPGLASLTPAGKEEGAGTGHGAVRLAAFPTFCGRCTERQPHAGSAGHAPDH